MNNNEESYKVVVLSTSHLSKKDVEALDHAISDGDNMVLKRMTGFFIKLYPSNTASNFRHGHSESIKKLISWALNKGYQMIEFDCDGNLVPQFPTYEW